VNNKQLKPLEDSMDQHHHQVWVEVPEEAEEEDKFQDSRP